jgi:hypothetical protein
MVEQVARSREKYAGPEILFDRGVGRDDGTLIGVQRTVPRLRLVP